MKMYDVIPKSLAISLLLIACVSVQAQVYREVGADGVPVFSDQATPGAEKVEIKEPMTFSTEEFLTQPNKPERETVKLSPKASDYDARIVSPANDEAIRENSGTLTLNISITPTLSGGHSAALTMNGTKIRSINGSGSITLTNVDRGTHLFAVQILDNKGNVVETSPSTSITMLRAAIKKQPRPTPRS